MQRRRAGGRHHSPGSQAGSATSPGLCGRRLSRGASQLAGPALTSSPNQFPVGSCPCSGPIGKIQFFRSRPRQTPARHCLGMLGSVVSGAAAGVSLTSSGGLRQDAGSKPKSRKVPQAGQIAWDRVSPERSGQALPSLLFVPETTSFLRTPPTTGSSIQACSANAHRALSGHLVFAVPGKALGD